MSVNNSLPFKAINPDLRKYGSVLRGKTCILEGLISAGKSTAGQELELFVTKLGIPCKFFPEPLIPELLSLFLSDQRKYAFSFQLTMLVKRQAIYREAAEYAKKGYFCIIDRSIHGDYCFALMHKNRGNITDGSTTKPLIVDGPTFCSDHSCSCEFPAKNKSAGPGEWKSYLATLNSEKFEHPDYVMYLEVTPETAMKRCAKRARPGEKGYEKAYFVELCQVYSSVIPSSPASQILVVDWNEDRETETIARFLLDEMKKAYDLNGAC